MPKSVTVDLDEPVLEALDCAAERSGRSRADIIAEAVRDYLETQRWQIEKIEAGIAAADRGDFASEERSSGSSASMQRRNEGCLDPAGDARSRGTEGNLILCRDGLE